MPILPDLNPVQRHMRARVEYYAAAADRPELDILFEMFGDVWTLEDLAAVASAITGETWDVARVTARLVGGPEVGTACADSNRSEGGAE